MRTILPTLLLLGLMICCSQAHAAQLKIYILAGQSNMEGHAHVRTFPHIGMDPATKPLLEMMQDGEGKPRVAERVWVSYLTNAPEPKVGKLTAGFGALKGGPKIGPEFTFGLALEKRMENPILLIKTAWGGKSLHTDFRPPSAGKYEPNEGTKKHLESKGQDLAEWQAKKDEATGVYYRLMRDHVKKVLSNLKDVCPAYNEADGYELAGFVWFQGWNDMVDRGTYPNRHKTGGYEAYTTALTHFIRDVRKEFSAPKLPFVIGVMGTGGPLDLENPGRYTPIHNEFRLAMAAPAKLPEFKDNVIAVLTEKCWDKQLGDLDARWGKVKGKQRELGKDKSLSKEQREAAVQAFIKEHFTEEELKIKQVGISNFGFHYLGSGKVFARIGVAFADALVPPSAQ